METNEVNFFSPGDQEIIDKFDNEYKSSQATGSAYEVLKRVAGNKGWGSKGKATLANTTIDEYYELFKSLKGQNLRTHIDNCLMFGKIGNTDEQEKEIANRATQALKKIAGENKLNKLRVKRFFDVEADE